MITAENVRKRALELGADVVGIGDIARFDGTDPQRDPRMILPNAKCVIGCGFRVPRYLYQAMHDKAQYMNYTQLGVRCIDEELAEIFLLRMAAMIEDDGYDACVQRNVCNLRVKGDKGTNPEVMDTYELAHAEAIAPGKPAPDVIMDFNEAARICGLGRVGYSGHFISPKFGPYIRFVFIVTDAPLECDAEYTGTLCDKCGKCASACPGHAISEMGTDSWQCAVYYRGASRENPFMDGEFLKGESFREEVLSGKARFDSVSAREMYSKERFLNTNPTGGYAPCICGRACDYACYRHLKEAGLI